MRALRLFWAGPIAQQPPRCVSLATRSSLVALGHPRWLLLRLPCPGPKLGGGDPGCGRHPGTPPTRPLLGAGLGLHPCHFHVGSQLPQCCGHSVGWLGPRLGGTGSDEPSSLQSRMALKLFPRVPQARLTHLWPVCLERRGGDLSGIQAHVGSFSFTAKCTRQHQLNDHSGISDLKFSPPSVSSACGTVSQKEQFFQPREFCQSPVTVGEVSDRSRKPLCLHDHTAQTAQGRCECFTDPVFHALR